MIIVKLDGRGIYESHREATKYDTWSAMELRDVELPELKDGKFYRYNINSWEELDEYPVAIVETIVQVPSSISPRQARLILLQYGLLDDIESMLATDRAMQIWWEYSLEVDRNNQHIINAGIALKLTDEQLDEMFIEGSKL